MRQLTQKLKNGEMKVLEVPLPHLQKGNILVKNHYSLISAGTEVSTVKAARKGYIGKAKERPQQLKQAVDMFQSQGARQTYRAVMKKLDAYSPLGYSCAGEVINVSASVKGIKTGDLVACAGLTASHAEIVSVPKNLCVKLRPDTNLKLAAYNTIGTIALQGVRQADLRIGESCAVIGLGLIGQLTGLILRASGIKVVGIDIDNSMVEVAKHHCADLALNRNDKGIENKIHSFTNELGCDAVIITAASKSLDPINFAGTISRKKGTVVIVGDVPTGFNREPDFYKKELKVLMSCSYGPGRYDPFYEEKGIDYPPAFVRWTENRNMQIFQELLYSKKIDINYLTTHIFELDKVPDAYEMMVSRQEPFIGLIIKYDAGKEIKRTKIKTKLLFDESRRSKRVYIGFIGAGSYAQSHLLPNIKGNSNVSLKGIMTTTGISSRSVAERFGFEFCTTNEKDILENEDINTVFIATRHDSHGDYIMKALEYGKHVFVEKPLCLNIQELDEIAKLVEQNIKKGSHKILMVGYNRRFSPLAIKIKTELGSGTMAMIYRVNAGATHGNSWIQDSEIGGGRIVGEVCHFVDFMNYINGSRAKSVYAVSMKDTHDYDDILNVSLSFRNGSIGTISYFANGDKSLPKERAEFFANGCTAILEDFKKLTIYAKGKKKVKKLLSQDKGQKNEIEKFLTAVLGGKQELISFDEIYNSSFVTFKIAESIRTRKCFQI